MIRYFSSFILKNSTLFVDVIYILFDIIWYLNISNFMQRNMLKYHLAFDSQTVCIYLFYLLLFCLNLNEWSDESVKQASKPGVVASITQWVWIRTLPVTFILWFTSYSIILNPYSINIYLISITCQLEFKFNDWNKYEFMTQIKLNIIMNCIKCKVCRIL